MIEKFEKQLAELLGEVTSVGASSWLHFFTWVAALLLAFFAWLSIRRQSLQSRAALLKSIYEEWIVLEKERRAFSDSMRTVKEQVLRNNSNLNSAAQRIKLKEEFSSELRKMKDERSPVFADFIKYVSFFEFIGLFVRKRYIPFKDIYSLYKGPILDLENACPDFIKSWQEEAHMAPGLLENALYLMKRSHDRANRPIYYFTFRTLFTAAKTLRLKVVRH